MGSGPDPGQSPPMFPGLMPSTGRFTLPKGFSPPRETSPPQDATEDMDLDASTAAAVAEWEAIRQAFEAFRNNLGADFAPLGLEHTGTPEMTPFGPALMYRTFSIAGIWMNYFMGLIVLYRSMPSMPPVAMAAAGIAAQQTAPWACEIARITAGLCENLNNQATVSMLVGAACIESGFCLFVAGVQVRLLRSENRIWQIDKLGFSISVKTKDTGSSGVCTVFHASLVGNQRDKLPTAASRPGSRLRSSGGVPRTKAPPISARCTRTPSGCAPGGLTGGFKTLRLMIDLCL